MSWGCPEYPKKKQHWCLGKCPKKKCGASGASGECAQINELLNVQNIQNKYTKCNTCPESVQNIRKKNSLGAHVNVLEECGTSGACTNK